MVTLLPELIKWTGICREKRHLGARRLFSRTIPARAGRIPKGLGRILRLVEMRQNTII